MFNLERVGGSIRELLAGKKEKEKEVSVPDIYGQFIHGIIGHEQMFKMLPVEKVQDFIDYHHEKRGALENIEDRRLVFKLNQLDNLTGPDNVLEKKVSEAHGVNVIEKWN